MEGENIIEANRGDKVVISWFLSKHVLLRSFALVTEPVIYLRGLLLPFMMCSTNEAFGISGVVGFGGSSCVPSPWTWFLDEGRAFDQNQEYQFYFNELKGTQKRMTFFKKIIESLTPSSLGLLVFICATT